jgi:hypothetical protein
VAATVVVTGLAQIQRDLARSVPEVELAVQRGLREAAEPVARLAEELSLSRIRGMRRSPAWTTTRIGVIRKGVYIVPKQRGVRSGRGDDPRRRPNLVELMMGRSFEPALELGAPLVEQRVATLIGDVTRNI